MLRIETEIHYGITVVKTFNNQDQLVKVENSNGFTGEYEYSENGEVSRYENSDGILEINGIKIYPHNQWS